MKTRLSLDKKPNVRQNMIGKSRFVMRHIDNMMRRGPMFISDPLPFVKTYIEELDNAIKKYDARAKFLKPRNRGWRSV